MAAWDRGAKPAAPKAALFGESQVLPSGAY
jgi:hypothetical protein